MVWKWRMEILTTLEKRELKSTREVCREAGKRVNKILNWSDVFRTLERLDKKNLVEKFETNGGFLWRKKEMDHQNKKHF